MTARIRVVHCIDNLGIGGTELNAVRTLERLDRARFHASIVCLREGGELVERCRSAGIEVMPLPVSRLHGADALRLGLQLRGWLRRERVQIVHSHDIYTNVFATLWARAARVPLVIASRRWWHSLPRASHRIANAVAYRVADCVLANSPAVARSLVDDQGIAAGRVLTIPNFVEEDAFAAPDADARRRFMQELGVPANALVAGIVARLTAVKDHGSLLHAVSRLIGRHPMLHVVLVGDGPCRGPLEELARSLGIAAHVHFAGQRSQAGRLHGLFDISVLCSTTEGFPNSVVEAMAAGRPVVATEVGGVPDALEAGVTGLLVPPSDSNALGDAIEVLARDADLRAAFGAAGRRAARERFHAASVIPRLERAYIERLEARRAGS